jgi:3-methylcrotonyl-CoA carboxylase alpha subunit
VRLLFLESGLRVVIDGRNHALCGERLPDGRLLVRLDERAFKARAVREGHDWHVFCEGEYRRLALRQELAGTDEDTRAGSLAAPMPGKIIKVMAQAGAKVTKGQALLILEAMKMEHTITAPADGVVKEIHYAAGDQVLEGVELLTLAEK